ncbi:MAG TPA: membrane protein insertase YidC, partial [Sphingomicrobium sp.]|nr:membrane protein insertase YidC [Sphingomicrobium sp.]
MNDNRNMILAVVLSLIVLVGWSYLAEYWFPVSQPQTQQVENGKVQPAPPPATSPAAPAALRSRAAVISSTPRVRFQTPSISGSINLHGARIDDLVMLKQRSTVDPNSPPVPLLSPQGARAASFIGFGWNGDGISLPGPDTLWQSSSPRLAPGRPVTLSWTSPAGLRFEINVAVDDQYLFTVTQRVTNAGAAPVAIRPYAYASRAGRSIDVDSWTVHIGPIRVANGEADYEVDWSTIREAGPGGLNFDRSTGWIGFTDKYWLTALAPAGPTTSAFRHSASGPYQADVAGDEQIVSPGQTLQFQTRIFSGVKEKAALDRYDAAGIDQLSKAIDWGWFEWFMRPIFNLLNWLFGVLGNFGLAIIALT